MKRLIFLLLITGCINVSAQKKLLTIQILDGESKKPVRGAQVTTAISNISVLSNHLGFIEVEVIDNEEIVVTSIGYEQSTIQPPSASQFKILLTKKLTLLSALNLNSDKTLKVYIRLSMPDVRLDYGQSATYPDGWNQFYNMLAEQLEGDTSLLELNSPIEVRFNVNKEGVVDEITTTPDVRLKAIQRAFSKLKNWQPAVQGNFPVNQSFAFLVMREVSTPSTVVAMELTAEPKGGMTAFYGHIAQNLNYPKQARKEKIEGRVMLKFIVDSDGSIKDVQVLQGIGGGCDEEAVRVVSSSPKWKPGTLRGVPVPQEIRLPIQFRL